MKNNIGGTLQGISLDAFLQMAHMGQITCTLSVVSRGKKGTLFLQDGAIISAEADGLSPLDAAHRIISWEKSVVDIAESCSKTVDELKKPLMSILMDAMQLRDNAASDPEIALPETGESTPPENPAPEQSSATTEKTATGSNLSDKKRQPTPGSGKNAPPTVPAFDSLRGLPWKYFVSGLALLIVGAGLTFYFLSATKRTRIEYETLVQTVEITEGTTEKLALLNAYARDNHGGKYTPETKRMIEDLMALKTAREFEKIEQTAARLTAGGHIEEAIAEYKNYLEESENGPYRNKVSQAIKNLSAQIESADFEEMKREAMSQGPERISTYLAFFEKHPDSNHREDILKLISDMEEESFIFLQRRFLANETPDRVAETIELGQQFLDTYLGSAHTETINRMLDNCRSKLLATLSFEQLQTRANAFGADYKSARFVYEDYLKAYPGSPVRENIGREINRLTNLAEDVRLVEATSRATKTLTESGTRFKIENNETVLDNKTGLMWCLLDSHTVADKCMDYDKATTYVAALQTGGHDDWRLPTPKELSALYQKSPSFPSDPEEWYWSSKNEKRHVGQWIIEVTVFQPDQPEGRDVLEKESWECGSVRAVRRP